MGTVHAPGKRRDLQADGATRYDPIEDLLELRERIDVGHRKAEILDGRLVVSAAPVLWHDRACRWLDRYLMDPCEAKGWYVSSHSEIELPPTRDRIEPDRLVIRNPDELPALKSLIPLSHVLLVAEVVSPSGVEDDRKVKPLSCARAGVPFYLLIDRLTRPLTVTLHTEPGDKGYATSDTVPAGGKLYIPDPFAITLDTAMLPLPR